MLDGRVITGYVVRVLLVLSALGLVYSVVLHALALTGEAHENDECIALMYKGWVIVCMASVFVYHQLARCYRKQKGWRVVLRGCPKWMKRAFLALGAYCTLAEVVAYVLYRFWPQPNGPWTADVSNMVMMTALSMFVYGLSTAILYSGVKLLYTKTPDRD